MKLKFLFFVFLAVMLQSAYSQPADLPVPIVDVINNPSPGGIFLSPFGPSVSDTGKYKNYFMIVDTAFNVVSYRLVPDQDKGFIGYHFKEEPNGYLSYMSRKMDGRIFLTDTAYNIITSFKDTTNPFNRVKYFAHFNLLPNGNYLTVRYDFMYVDLTKYFPQGEPNGAILQAVIQELDKDKNVVFQWRSIDYVPVSNTLDQPTPAIDYFHPNSQVLDHDGNLLISGRDIGAILKINRNTGDIIWTLGGKKNEFTFIGEHEENAPTYFSYQHDIRRLTNGNISIFDNGRQHNPPYSRAVEYKLDEINKTCTMVWEYDHNKEFFADVFGTTQRLPNGNTLIGWGSYSVNGGTALQELHPDNTVAMECHFPPGMQSQFIYKYPWPVCPKIASVTKSELMESNTYDFNTETNKTGIKMTMNKFDGFIYNNLKVEKYHCSPINPEFTGRPPIVSPYRLLFKPTDIYSFVAEVHVNLNEYPEVFQPGKSMLYSRPVEGKGLFKPLQTTYDPTKNELIAIADTTGEFIIGFPDSAKITAPPIMLNPPNMEKINILKPVKFEWNPRGYFTGSQLQVASDTNFSNILIDTSLKVISFSSSSFTKSEKYFWRVKSSNDAGASNWSEIRSFTPSDPYLTIRIPNGGEIWDTTNHIIRWEYNIKDSVDQFFKIELYRADTLFKAIVPSRFSAVNAFKWKIPANTPEDSTYKVKVTSITNPSIFSMSSNYFTIKNSITAVEDDIAPNDITLEQNSPNPFSISTQFRFSIAQPGNIDLSLFDVFGNKIVSLMQGYLESGPHSIDFNAGQLPSGYYFCRLRAGLSQSIIKVTIAK